MGKIIFMFTTMGFLSLIRAIRKHPNISIFIFAFFAIYTLIMTGNIIKSLITIPVIILVAFCIFGTLFLLVNVSTLVARFMCYIHNYDIRDF